MIVRLKSRLPSGEIILSLVKLNYYYFSMQQSVLIKRLLIVIGLFAFQTTIYGQVKNNASAAFRKIMIDPVNAMGGIAAKYFEQVNYIPLETNKESLFGKIDQLVITDDYFIILDKTTDAILFFSRDGRFHHKITRFSFDKIFQIPNIRGVQRNILSSFSADPVKHQLYVMSVFERGVLYIYTFNGERIGKVTLPEHTQDYFMLGDGTVFYKQFRPISNSDLKGFRPYDVFFVKDSLSSPGYLFPVDFKYSSTLADMSLHMNYFTGIFNDSLCLYTPDFDYNLYELGKSGISYRYQFLFPQQMALPQNFDTDSIYTNRRREFLKDKSLINGIWSAFKIGNYLIVDIMVPGRNRFPLLYSLKTSRLINLDRIASDESTCQLPVSGYLRSEILSCDRENIYVSFPSVSMFGVKEQQGDKHPAYNAVLDIYFKTQDRKSNPVLVQLRPKSNI